MAYEDSHLRAARDPGEVNVWLILDYERLAPDDPYEWDPCQSGQQDQEQSEALSEQEDTYQSDHQEGERLPYIHYSGDDFVHPAARIATECSERGANNEAAEQRDSGHGQRYARAEQHPGENVASGVVGAEDMLSANLFVHDQDIGDESLRQPGRGLLPASYGAGIRVVGSQHGREDPAQYE